MLKLSKCTLATTHSNYDEESFENIAFKLFLLTFPIAFLGIESTTYVFVIYRSLVKFSLVHAFTSSSKDCSLKFSVDLYSSKGATIATARSP